jgi:exopolyphosphatase/guanosine-5'-triphosphate,3'-diphosphate pyrophosphatase
MRIAAIDIGTNSIHMVIADTTQLGTFDVVDREREVVQIGRGSFRDGRLRSEAIRATVEALARFADLARRQNVDRILCTATAAVREARNGGAFLSAAREASGVSPRVIPAEEEGRLVYLAVKAAVQLDDSPSLIVDIGGGSVQLVVGTREKLLLATSAPLGALRLSERMEMKDPPTKGDLNRLRRHVQRGSREALKRVLELEPTRAYGSSGSIQALAETTHWAEKGQAIGHINEHVLTLEGLKRTARRLSAMTLAERERLPGIDDKRAEIILPGAVVLEHVLKAAELDGITISDFGVREGLVTDYIAYHAEEISKLGAIEDLRLRSVLGLLNKFGADGKHPRHVASLALSIYDGLRASHRLPESQRELLYFAALLHDIGSAIGYDGHAEHSYYVIKNGNLRGLSAEEIELVANVARYHGKARPRKRDKPYRDLTKKDRRTVRWLAGILRIAEGLDRSHYQLIKAVRVVRRKSGVSLLVTATRNARLEIWAARQRTGVLERVFGASVRVASDPAVEARRRDRAEARHEKTPAPAKAPVLKTAANTRTAAPKVVAGRNPASKITPITPIRTGSGR